jgi:hypothetical protein
MVVLRFGGYFDRDEKKSSSEAIEKDSSGRRIIVRDF